LTCHAANSSPIHRESFAPAGKQIFIRYQSSVSLSRPLVSCRRAVSRGGRGYPINITRRQRRRADIHGLRAHSVYTTCYYMRVCVASRRTGAPPLSSFPPFSYPSYPWHRQKNVSQGVMRRRPSLDILPSSPTPFLPSSVLFPSPRQGPRGFQRGNEVAPPRFFRHNISYR